MDSVLGCSRSIGRYVRRTTIANDSNTLVTQIDIVIPVCRVEPVTLEVLDPCQFRRIVWRIEKASSCYKNAGVFDTPSSISEVNFDSICFRPRVPFRRCNFGIEDQVIIETVFFGQTLPVLLQYRLTDVGCIPIGV